MKARSWIVLSPLLLVAIPRLAAPPAKPGASGSSSAP